MKPLPCPVDVDASYGEPVEVVVFLESEFTVGTSRALLSRAVAFIEKKFQPLYGAPIRFIEGPSWHVQDMARLEVAA